MYGVRWQEIDKRGRFVTKARWFRSMDARERHVNRLFTKDWFWRIIAFEG